MSPSILSARDVNKIAARSLAAVFESLLASAFRLLSRGSDCELLHRTSITVSHHTVMFMPSRSEDFGTAIKVVSVPTSAKDNRGLPASTILMDEEMGRVEAIVKSSALTALGTAAGAVLTTRLHFPVPPTSLLAFDAGKQVEPHVDLHIHAFPCIRWCVIVNCSKG
ncbi:hypothetical protein BKA82DRAFT_3956972, partial [Pisolithus tinctorius]